MSPTTLISTQNWPRPLPLIPHLSVFSITRLDREHHLQTHEAPLQNSPCSKKRKFKLRMSLSFQFHITHPKLPQPPKWKSRSKQSPPMPIILVMPNYEIMKTLTMTLTTRDPPPSYYLPQYSLPSHDASRMFDKPTAYSSNHWRPATE